MRSALICVFLSAAVVAAAQSDRDIFRDAETRFRNQDYELALDRYETLIQEFPRSEYVPDAQFRRAVTLYRLRRYQEALELFARVERRYRSTEYLDLVPFWSGVVRYYTGAYDQSVEDLRRFLETDTSFESVIPDVLDQAHLYLGLSNLAMGQKEAAAEALEILLDFDPAEDRSIEAFDPQDTYALALLLSIYAEDGRYRAILDATSTIERESYEDPWSDQILLFVAEALRAGGEVGLARDIYEDLYDAPVEVASIAFQRSFQIASERGEETTSIVGRAEQALAGRTEVLRNFWLRVGIESFEEGRFDLSQLYLQRIWDLRTTESIDGIVPVYLSELYKRRGESRRAADILSTALELDLSRRDQMLFRLGTIHLDEGEFDQAAERLGTFLEENPDAPFYPQAAYQRVYALYRLENYSTVLGEIRAVRSGARAGALRDDFVRLEATVLRRLGRTADAVDALYEYILSRPADLSARAEYLKLLFVLERFSDVAEEGAEVLSALGADAPQRPVSEINYLVGLANVALARYEEALNYLGATPGQETTVEALPAELAVMRPYRLFYRGWSFYRLARYDSAIEAFDRLLDEQRDHPLAPRASYLAGWSAFSTQQLRQAVDYLQEARGLAKPGDRVAVESTFLLGQTQQSLGNDDEAKLAFRSVFLDYPSADLASEAHFEYATLLAEEGRTDQAAAELLTISATYPEASIAENALYRRAEVFYEANRPVEARDAFFAYRTEYPSGAFLDDALFYGGRASLESGEPAGALLLWTRLIDEYPRSPFRSEAMQLATQVHRERGDYRNALQMITRFIASYPEEAEAVGAERTADQISLLLRGLSEREAALWVAIEDNNEAETVDGRQAIIELGRSLIYEGTGTSLDQSLIVPLLRDVAEKTEADPAAASQAQFLVAEYHSRNRDHSLAAESFVTAATINPADSDLSALALYRAAESYKAAGRTDEMNVLIEEISTRFPDSEWSVQAERLQEGGE